MRRDPQQNPNPDSLPKEIAPDLRAIDRRLGRLAASRRVPDGLSDRVRRASNAGLPAPASARSRRPARTVWKPRLAGSSLDWRVMAAGWGRLALAAALGFAFVVGGVLLNNAPAAPDQVPVALDIGWLNEDPLDQMDAQVAYILDTGSIRSMDEVTGELESVIASFGM